MTSTAASGVGPGTRIRKSGWLSRGSVLGSALRSPRGSIGAALVGIVWAIAIVGPFVAPHGSNELVGIPFTPPSGRFVLGTDALGRDVLSRTLDGGRVLLVMGVCATALGVALGVMAGVAAGYLRGLKDMSIMRTVDVILAFPQIVFALMLVSILGPRLWLIVVAVALTHAPQVARVIRSATLDISERDFVKAAEIIGVRSWKIMAREIVPNLSTPITVEIGLRLTYSIVIISGLAFLGFGQAPPAASWGTMINENRDGISSNVWGVLGPALLLAILTIGVNTFTDAIGRVLIGVGRQSGETVDAPAAAAVKAALQGVGTTASSGGM